MISRLQALWYAGATGLAVLGLSVTVFADPPAAEEQPPAAQAEKEAKAPQRVSVEVARDRARLMHRIYASTLDVMHDHYFHGDRAIVPARAMEDIFEELNRQSDVTARWIAVNTKAMSIDHEPENEFERKAAKEIAAGKEEFEVVENGFYRHAGAIPLAQGCIGCHTGFFGKPTKTPRFAGLVISVPVNQE